jgi:imidazolonepropionase-like amidohydrolase
MVIAACAGEPEGVADFDNIFDVRCGVLIDGLGGDPRRDQLVSIRGDRIVAVTDVAGSHADADLDLSSYTCLPGLIDTHVHLASKASDSADMAGIYRRSTEATTSIAEESARSTLEAGFTTVSNVGDYFPAVVLDVKQRIDRGELEGPRVQTAGPYLTIPGGGGDMAVPGEDESLIPAAVRVGVARGPDDFAAKTQAAIDAGVDSIEHASLADDDVIALAAERGVAFSMDVYNGTYTAEVGEELGYPEEFIRKNDETTEAQRVVFEKAYAAGVPILFGTDAAVYPHGLNARQFSVMVERGMAPMDAIRSPTSVAALHMGLDGDVGALEPGRFGDLIAVRGDPLADISVLEDVTVVTKGGEVVKRP